MININLKEVFAVDNQTDLAAKLNFNFNQLLSLGVGQPGATGETGPTGAAGPIGPIGNPGTPGSQIFSTSGGTLETLGDDPIDAIVGDYYISNGAIYKKTDDYETTGQWQTVSNFYDIFNSISSAGTSTWQLGAVDPDALSRLLAPVKTYSGYDRINSMSGTSGEWQTNDPNWLNGSVGFSNSQVTVFNFDPNTVKTFTDVTADTNGYGVNVIADRLGTSGVTDTAFPYTALMSLYSFYQSGAADVDAVQFDDIDGSATGFRHQIELGSVDELPEMLVSTSGSANYVVSPTWQNLRIRKYRKQETSLPGQAIVNADFNLGSSDASKQPALNSRFTWTINKKTTSINNSGSNVQLSLSNSQIEGSTQALTGIGVDGLHIRSGAGGEYKLAIGVDPNNGVGIKNALISSDAANSLTAVVFNNLPIRVRNTVNGSTSYLGSTEFSSNKTLTIGTTGNQTDTIVTAGSSGKSVYVISPANTQTVYMGYSTSGTSNNWTTSSGYAIKVQKNRLAAGLPFPVSTSAVPPASSTDPNVLDEYMEMEFTPIISWGTLPTAGTGVLTGSPTISNESGYFIKIGKMVHFNIQFRISGWKANIPGTFAGKVYPGGASRDLALLDYGNLSTSATDPFSQLKLGDEYRPIVIQGLPDQWPNCYVSNGGIKFNVCLSTGTDGEPALRGNPFIYSWGGTGTNGTAGTAGTSGTSSRPWSALDPASVHATMSYYNDGSRNFPQIDLWGHRRYPIINTYEDLAGAVSPNKSRVSIYDFLRPFSTDRSIYVTVSGSYMTAHQLTNTAIPYSGGGGGGGA